MLRGVIAALQPAADDQSEAARTVLIQPVRFPSIAAIRRSGPAGIGAPLAGQLLSASGFTACCAEQHWDADVSDRDERPGGQRLAVKRPGRASGLCAVRAHNQMTGGVRHDGVDQVRFVGGDQQRRIRAIGIAAAIQLRPLLQGFLLTKHGSARTPGSRWSLLLLS